MQTKPDSARTGVSGGFAIKARIRSILGSVDFERALREIDITPEKLINPMLSFLCATDETVRWRAVRAVGLTVSRIVPNSVETARNIVRRLIWSLNDESGGIGWGAPEAMGEIMAEDGQLASEYHCILLSYIDECGNPLEHDILERGALWGIGRLARARPELVRGAVDILVRRLSSPDPVKRGLALRAVGFARPDAGPARKVIEPMLVDESELRIYEDGELKTLRIRDIAAEILAGIVTTSSLE